MRSIVRQPRRTARRPTSSHSTPRARSLLYASKKGCHRGVVSGTERPLHFCLGRSRLYPVKRVRFLLILLVVIAAAARLPGLGRSLWYDELFTIRHFTDTLPHALTAQKAANNHPLA